jgi:hypothetical protein
MEPFEPAATLRIRSAYSGNMSEFRRACFEEYMEIVARPNGRGALEQDALECREAATWVTIELGPALGRLARARAEEAETILAMDPARLEDALRRRRWRKNMLKGGGGDH